MTAFLPKVVSQLLIKIKNCQTLRTRSAISGSSLAGWKRRLCFCQKISLSFQRRTLSLKWTASVNIPVHKMSIRFETVNYCPVNETSFRRILKLLIKGSFTVQILKYEVNTIEKHIFLRNNSCGTSMTYSFNVFTDPRTHDGQLQ